MFQFKDLFFEFLCLILGCIKVLLVFLFYWSFNFTLLQKLFFQIMNLSFQFIDLLFKLPDLWRSSFFCWDFYCLIINSWASKCLNLQFGLLELLDILILNFSLLLYVHIFYFFDLFFEVVILISQSLNICFIYFLIYFKLFNCSF